MTEREPHPLPPPPRNDGLSQHILPASATMLGVCMTVLSIGHLGPRGPMRILVDKLLAVDAIIFLLSALLSFLAMRARRREPAYEARAEWVFVLGLGLLTVLAVALALVID